MEFIAAISLNKIYLLDKVAVSAVSLSTIKYIPLFPSQGINLVILLILEKPVLQQAW